MPAGCWRPLAPLARLEPAPARTLASLVAGLKDTPYAPLAAETWRSHGDDLAAAELAFDGWALSAVHAAAAALPECEAAARDLLFGLLRERDLDLLRRGCDAYGLEPMFAVGLTTVLRRDHGRDALRPLAAWTPSSGTFAAVLPPALARMAGGARDWDALMAALRHGRTVACRRALMAWPFQIAPIVAAVMLREDQMRAWASLAAVERSA
jgi:hypothetical protein